MDNLCARIAQSSGKPKPAVSQLFKLFMETCPEVFTTKVYNKVEQVLGHYCKQAPNFDAMEKAIKTALNSSKSWYKEWCFVVWIEMY